MQAKVAEDLIWAFPAFTKGAMKETKNALWSCKQLPERMKAGFVLRQGCFLEDQLQLGIRKNDKTKTFHINWFQFLKFILRVVRKLMFKGVSELLIDARIDIFSLIDINDTNSWRICQNFFLSKKLLK